MFILLGRSTRCFGYSPVGPFVDTFDPLVAHFRTTIGFDDIIDILMLEWLDSLCRQIHPPHKLFFLAVFVIVVFPNLLALFDHCQIRFLSQTPT